MSDAVVVVAHLKATEGNEAKVEAALTELVAASQGDDGCERYGLHKDVGDASKLTFVEKWSSMETLGAHGNAPHMAVFGELMADGSIVDVDLRVLSPVEAGDPDKAL